MSSLDWDESVFLPAEAECFEYLREQRWPEGPTCPHCHETDLLRKGTSSKGAQQYYCYGCERRFNDLTGTIFAQHRMSIAEMFYIVRKVIHESTAEISRSLDRTYKTVLEFVHEVQEAAPDDDFELAGVCEADEVYVVAGEKGRDQDDPRELAVVIASSYDLRRAGPMFESARDEGVCYTHAETLDGTHLGSVRHEEWEPLVPDPGGGDGRQRDDRTRRGDGRRRNDNRNGATARDRSSSEDA